MALWDDTKRMNYRDGQYLGPSDFMLEQRYHRDMRRRLSLGQHTWGIFTGLELSEQPREGSTTDVDVFITPGLAIDGYGREIVNYAAFKLEPALFNRMTGDQFVKVWISYATEPVDLLRDGYQLCDDPDYRNHTRETFKVEVGERPTPCDPVVIAGRRITLPDTSLPVDLSIPHQALPDDDEVVRWLVPLGEVHWNGSDGFVKADPQDPDDIAQRKRGRVYGGVVSAHTYAIDSTWELVVRPPAPPPPPLGPAPPAPRAEGFIRGKLTVEDLLIVQDEGIRLDDSPISFADQQGDDRGRPLVLSRFDHSDSADLIVKVGDASAGKNRLVIRSSTTDRVTIADDGTVAVLGGRVTLQQAATGAANWGIKVDGANLQFLEPDDNDRVVFEILDIGDDLGNPALRLHGEADATLSAEQLVDLTDGGETFLHTHRNATDLVKGMVEIAVPDETAFSGGSGARLVIPANDPRLLTQAQKNDLTDGGMTSLHHHPNGMLNNVRTVWLAGLDGARTDIQTINLGTPKRVVAFIALHAMDPLSDFDRGDGYFAEIYQIDGAYSSLGWFGGDHLGPSGADANMRTPIYAGIATSVTFRLRTVQDATVWAFGIVFFEDI
jgi:hypothetical protein